jgi:hypothetical protein
MADISSESMCTHSDSSCDEYIVTSLDDSSTSSGAAAPVTFCPTGHWNTDMGMTANVMPRLPQNALLPHQTEAFGAEADVKMESGE